MPSGRSKPPSDPPKPPISPPPHSLTGAGAADIAANYSRANALARALTHPSPKEGLSILTPRSGTDIVALIFILLNIPQGVSCLILTAYILLNSFKSVVGKLLAKCLIHSDGGVNYSFESGSRSRYYRSELIGEFLQLFSINSFILLVCHYTMPHSWFPYLIVLAKSIIASRLIGSYSLASNTYVSVVSSSASNSGVMITTTTMSNGDNWPRRSNELSRAFYKFTQGIVVVLAIQFMIRTWLSSFNLAEMSERLILFYRNYVLSKEKTTTADRIMRTISNSPVRFLTHDSNFTALGNPKTLEKVLFQLALDHLPLGQTSLETVVFVVQEFIVGINYAYLVLCIHVISLTISPLLKKFFILRTYSKTLDHLSSLSPDIPFGGLKRDGTAILLSKEADSPIVLNIDLVQPASDSLGMTPEMKVDPSIADSQLKFDLEGSAMTVAAENFKTFCMSSSKSLQITSGVKPSLKTIVDRKNASSAITPSTTIMDKLYIISIQPLWSWLAAVKIIFKQPVLFSKSSAERDISELDCALMKPKTAISHIDESYVILESLDESFGPTETKSVSVKVNEIDWPFYALVSSDGKSDDSLRVEALSPLMQYSIVIHKNGALFGSHLMVTQGISINKADSQVGERTTTLQSSLLHSIRSLSQIKSESKKQKKDENKRVADLKKKIDILKSKIGKYGKKETNEVRVSSKLKGLLNAAHQLENEIKEIENSIHAYESSESKYDSEYIKEETLLEEQIEKMEASMKQTETEIIRLKADLKRVGGEKYFTEVKLEEVTAKLSGKKDEVAQTRNELKSLKKAFIFKLQKRQVRLRDRFETIIPRITEATDALSEEFKAYLDEVSEHRDHKQNAF